MAIPNEWAIIAAPAGSRKLQLDCIVLHTQLGLSLTAHTSSAGDMGACCACHNQARCQVSRHRAVDGMRLHHLLGRPANGGSVYNKHLVVIHAKPHELVAWRCACSCQMCHAHQRLAVPFTSLDALKACAILLRYPPKFVARRLTCTCFTSLPASSTISCGAHLIYGSQSPYLHLWCRTDVT